jgi:hypothetical protein
MLLVAVSSHGGDDPDREQANVDHRFVDGYRGLNTHATPLEPAIVQASSANNQESL